MSKMLTARVRTLGQNILPYINQFTNIPSGDSKPLSSNPLAVAPIREMIYDFFDSHLPIHKKLPLPFRPSIFNHVPHPNHAEYLLGLFHMLDTRLYVPFLQSLSNAAISLFLTSKPEVYSVLYLNPELSHMSNYPILTQTFLAHASFGDQVNFLHSLDPTVLFHSVKASYLLLLSNHEEPEIRERGCLLMLMEIRDALQRLIDLGASSFAESLEVNFQLFSYNLALRCNTVSGGFNLRSQEMIRDYGTNFFYQLTTSLKHP